MDSTPTPSPLDPADEPGGAGAASTSPVSPASAAPGAGLVEGGDGTYCPRCGFLVHFEHNRCPDCGHDIDHHPSNLQRHLLLGALGFIFLGGILIFNQPKAYHTFMQDLFECGIILCVASAGVCFFIAVVDMVRREGH